MAMPGKRTPLALMIAMKAKKGASKDDSDDSGESDEPDEGSPEEESADEDELTACSDIIDGMAKRDPKELNTALHHWMQIAGYSRGGE